MVNKFFDKETSGSGIKRETISNQRLLDLARVAKVCDRTPELAEELHKPIIRKLKKRKVNSLLIKIILGADFADMQLICKFNNGIRFSLCAIDIFSKYTWVIPVKDKKGITITNAFQKNLNESNRKAKKVCADNGSEFYNRSRKSWLEKNTIDMYLKHHKGKSVVAEKFI